MLLHSEHANILYQVFAVIHLGFCHLTFHPGIGLESESLSEISVSAVLSTQCSTHCRVSPSIAFLISVSVFFFKSYKNLNFPFGKWPNELQFLLVIFSFNGSYNRKDLKYIISKQSSLLTATKDGFNKWWVTWNVYPTQVEYQNLPFQWIAHWCKYKVTFEFGLCSFSRLSEHCNIPCS